MPASRSSLRTPNGFRIAARCNAHADRSGGLGLAAVNVRKRPRPSRVAAVDVAQAETGRDDELVDPSIEVAAAGERAPRGIQAVLPARDRNVGREAVLGEEERTAR